MANAAAEAEASSARFNAARAREALLVEQLGEVEREAEALQQEHQTLLSMVERRRAAQQADELVLSEAASQVDAERREAQRVLTEAIAQLTRARGEVSALETALPPSSSASATDEKHAAGRLAPLEHGADLLRLARQRAAEAEAALGALQSEEARREAARRQKLHAHQVCA